MTGSLSADDLYLALDLLFAWFHYKDIAVYNLTIIFHKTSSILQDFDLDEQNEIKDWFFWSWDRIRARVAIIIRINSKQIKVGNHSSSYKFQCKFSKSYTIKCLLTLSKFDKRN